MKKKLLAFATILFFATLISLRTFAQTVPGGSAGEPGAGDPLPPPDVSVDDDGAFAGVIEPCPIYFKRNNGNGTCGGDAQIRLSFGLIPDYAPTLVAIFYNGNPVDGIMLPVQGDASTIKKGYVSYCISGSNLDPAKKLVLQFHYQNGQPDCLIPE